MAIDLTPGRMKLIADQNIGKTIVSGIRADGHDVLWVHEKDPWMTDIDIMAWALETHRLILTHDLGFSIRMRRTENAHLTGIILLRTFGLRRELQLHLLRLALAKHLELFGVILVIDPASSRLHRIGE